MTLAAILLFSISFSTSTWSQAQQQSTAPTGSGPAPAAAAPEQTPTVQKPPTAKPRRHKKKATASNCNVSATTTGSAPLGSTDPASTPATTNCPPAKIIVRQGGTSEPSIQLAGGAVGDQAAHQRDVANQMLGAAEANLKRFAGRQLTQNQQDMVNQVHQFEEQSKAALTAGDLDRARTLAWKAQLLSEELAKADK